MKQLLLLSIILTQKAGDGSEVNPESWTQLESSHEL